MKKGVSEQDRAALTLFKRLPHRFREGDVLPRDLVGASIRQIGTTDVDRESGEFVLVLEYVPKGGTRAKRLTLLFNERGMWIDDLSEESPILDAISKFALGLRK